MHFQDIILNLESYWSARGCVITQPYDTEVGAGHLLPFGTFLKALGSEPWRTAYVAPSRRPTDGRYGENPYRFQYYFQYQVLLKPSPMDVQDLYLGSLYTLGIDPHAHDIRFRRGQLGAALSGRVGPGLGGADGRHGNKPVHLLPASRRGEPKARVGGAYLRLGAHRDVPAGRLARL